jgi:hypothetical protein
MMFCSGKIATFKEPVVVTMQGLKQQLTKN